MKYNRTTFQLGDLITALYEEISPITTNQRLQAKLVYLALMDLKLSGRLTPARKKY
jgi:hypothetical protein